ncbi:MAG: hypothetical protein WCO13_09555 [Bacteroidota bacterium]
MKKMLLTLFVFIAITFVFTSCNKNTDTTNPLNFNQQSALAQNYAFIQDVYGDIFDLVCQASGDSALMASHTGTIAGATVVFDSITNKFIFTFPTKSTNGKAGEFTADLDGNGDFQEVGTVAHISFNDYKVNGNSVQGSNDITNRGKIGGKKTTGTIITYTDSVFATIIKGADTIHVTANYNVDWSLGDTSTVLDDQYLFSGSINGYSNPNKWFQADVSPTNKVLVTPACQWIQSGIISAQMHTLDASNNPKLTTVQIDFLPGCTKQVQVTMDDGSSITFDMPN